MGRSCTVANCVCAPSTSQLCVGLSQMSCRSLHLSSGALVSRVDLLTLLSMSCLICLAAIGSVISVSCSSTAAYPPSFTLTLRATTNPTSCQVASTVTTTVLSLCCVSSTTVSAFVRGSGSTSTATCLSSCGGWVNRFTGPSPATAYPITTGASTLTCSGGRSVGSLTVQCTSAGSNVAAVSFAAPVQTSLSAISARFFVGCQAPTSCFATGFGASSTTCLGTSTSCGGTMSLSAQTYTLPCVCSNVRWLYRQASSGFTTTRVNGACP